MSPSEHLASLSREDLLALVATLQRQIAALTARNEALHAEIERLRRGAKRQAAPFSKGTRVASPKRPGRKPGLGSFCSREAPRPEQITAPPVEVPVTLAACPACGGRLEEERVDWASTTEIPALPRPTGTHYRVSVCRCLVCGKQVRGQHPDVAPDQYGATAHRVGDRPLATAQGWHDGRGIPVRKVPLVLEAMQGITLTQGALTQDALRRARGEVGKTSERLRTTVPTCPIVHPDDTGWRVRATPPP
jgi:transposase